ncbi:cytochrome P450 2C8-like [Erpetoichthys calabaricus]|uniref:cytochrome P450 2C8-like n=1 Tax=Erpetoichthys calabaricus TaxID=27687 RepID=UPI0010A06D49|nr:cytochrome P450 2C8-like [Erpetoichthys calabaricus]
MELFGTLVLAAIVLVFFLLLFRRDSSRYSKMPPGPTPLPFVGNMLQLKPWVFLERIMKLQETYGPMVTVYFGWKPIVVLLGFQAVQEALVEQADVFAGRHVSQLIMKLTGDFGLVQSSGERWKQLRRFSISTLRDYGMGKRTIEEWIQEEARHLTEEFRKTKGSSCDPNIFLSRAVSNVICSIVFGQRFDYQDENFAKLLYLIDENMRLISSPVAMLYSVFPIFMKLFPGNLNKMLRNVKEVKQFTSSIIEKHKATLVSNSPRDFIDSFLIKMKEESDNPSNEFNYENLHITVLNLFTAGTETTSTTLRYGLLIFIKYSHIQENIQKEIDTVIGRDRAPAMQDRRKMPYTDAVIHEIQRFIDLIPLNVLHKTTMDTTLRGYFIPAGTIIAPMLHSVLYDKTKWATPHSFNPNHFLDENGCFKMNPAFMPFSTGKRLCAGEGLARMELFLFFTTLLQNFSFRSTEDLAHINLLPDSKSFFRRPQPYTFMAIPR